MAGRENVMPGGRGRGMVLPAWMTKEAANPQISPGLIGGLQADRRPPPLAPPPMLGIGMVHAPVAQTPVLGGVPSLVPPGRPPALIIPPKLVVPPKLTVPPMIPPMLPPRMPVHDWTEHKAPDGRSYYYNKVTKVSTYERPAIMGLHPPIPAPLPELPKPITTATTTPAIPLVVPVVPPCKWKEYDHNGKKYYSDGKNSVWEKPQELKDHEAAVAESKRIAEAIAKAKAEAEQAAAAAKAAAEEEEREEKLADMRRNSTSRVRTAIDVSKIETNEERKEAFLELLGEEGITSQTKWNDIEKACQEDPRWGLLKKGLRKQITTEYQNQRRKEEAKDERARAKKAKDAFLKMLATNFSIDGHSRWSDAKELLGSDIRFQNVPDDRVREEIFMEFTEELRKRDREEDLKRRKQALATYDELINGASKAGITITHTTRWSDVSMALSDMAAPDPLLSVLTDSEKRGVFQDHVSKLIREEDDRRLREREEKRRQDVIKRNEFETFLRAKLDSGGISADTKWKELRKEIEDEPEYRAMERQGPTSQRDVFDSIVDELRRQYREDRKLMDELLSSAKLIVKPETTQDEFEDALRNEEAALFEEKYPLLGADSGAEEGLNGHSKSKDVPHKSFSEILKKRRVNVELTFKNLMEKALIIRKEEERKRSRLEKLFNDLLLECFYRSDHVTAVWESGRTKIMTRAPSAVLELAEDIQQRLFDEHMLKLREAMAERAERQEKLKAEQEAKKQAARALAHEEGELSGPEEAKNEGKTDRGRTKEIKRERSPSGSIRSRSPSESRSSSRDKAKRHKKSSRRSSSRTRRKSRSHSRHRKSSRKTSKRKHKHRKHHKHSRSRSRSSKRNRKDSMDEEEGEIRPGV